MNVDELIAALLKQDKNSEVFFNAEKAGQLYSIDDVWECFDGKTILGGEEE